MTPQTAQKFDWLGELEKTTFNSLVTTFGLDFLLVQDKHGGDVDTIHNARQGIYATERAKQAYANRGEYNSHAYHSDSRYINRRQTDKSLQQAGQLQDNYTNQTLTAHSDTPDLDHIISAYEIHNDAGRVLAGLDGVSLANQDSNFQSTHKTVNRTKKQHSAEKYVNEILPKSIAMREQKLQTLRAELAKMPENTPQQRHDKRAKQAELQKTEKGIQALKNVDKQKMLEMDKKARQDYNRQVNDYYKSTKFIVATGTQSALMGAKMGFRQVLGLVLAEIWFELKVALPMILDNCRHNFNFRQFLDDIGTTLKNIFQRVTVRFKELLASFKDGFLGGVLASITNTITNIFFTTSKLIGKLIRESWQNMVKIAKLLFFNPDNLSNGQLFKEMTRIILASISTIIGVVINQYLATLFTFPLGVELATFLSALLTGILMVGCAYFIDYSTIMQKVWRFLDGLKDKYDNVLAHLQQANAELDEYLVQLTKVEFNLFPQELQAFNDELAICQDEYQKSKVIQKEIKRRNIELPFTMGDNNSTMQWLNALAQKH